MATWAAIRTTPRNSEWRTLQSEPLPRQSERRSLGRRVPVLSARCRPSIRPRLARNARRTVSRANSPRRDSAIIAVHGARLPSTPPLRHRTPGSMSCSAPTSRASQIGVACMSPCTSGTPSDQSTTPPFRAARDRPRQSLARTAEDRCARRRNATARRIPLGVHRCTAQAASSEAPSRRCAPRCVARAAPARFVARRRSHAPDQPEADPQPTDGARVPRSQWLMRRRVRTGRRISRTSGDIVTGVRINARSIAPNRCGSAHGHRGRMNAIARSVHVGVQVQHRVGE